MNLKEWYLNCIKGEWCDIIPVFKIDENSHAKEIISELERLGIYKGNIIADVEDAKFIDVWYKEFYNTFYAYNRVDADKEFFATLSELKDLVIMNEELK